MGFKKTIKRISALGIGASMVGATIFGAMAADLSNYPGQYIKDGKFTGVLVVGDKAAAEDVIGVSDIAVSLQFAATRPAGPGGSSVTVEGDAWKVGTSSKLLEMSEKLNSGTNTENIRNITTFIDDSNLNALASGTVTNGKGDAPFNQYLYLLGAANGLTTGYVAYTQNDDDVTADFLYFKSGQEIGRYVLEFTTALESDVDDSSGTQTSTGDFLTDFENTDLKMFGKTYSIVQARRNGGLLGQMKLILMGGATKDTLLEGGSKTYNIGGKDYEVSVNFVDSNSAKLTVNGQGTRDLLEGESDKLPDGTTVGISEILYQDYAGGVHSVTFFLGAQKVEMKDTNINNTDSSNSLKIDDQTIDNALVIIQGSDDGSTAKITRIQVNMTADDNFYVPEGGKLSENPNLDEPQVLFTNNWDIEYKGLNKVTTHPIKLKTSGSSAYELEFNDGNGNMVSLPFAKSPTGSTMSLGDTGKTLINRENVSIAKSDYFIVTDGSQKRGERKTFALQYKGSDKLSADNKKLKFKDLGSGDTIEQTYTNASPLATLKIGGTDYNVYAGNPSRDGTAAAEDLNTNDFSIWVDLDASGALNTGTNDTVLLTTKEGMEINFTNVTGKSAPSSSTIYASFRIPDNTRDSGAADKVESLQSTPYMINITAASGKVQFSQDTTTQAAYLNFLTPSGKTNVAYGYDSYGAFFTHETPSNDPATLTIAVPEMQREALVYVTAKGAALTSTSTSSGGAVSIQRIDVGATKLASEVANIKAVNSILVGGPCANAAAATVMGNPADCTAGFTPGVGKIQVWDVGTGNVAMLVAGYNAADTRNAATVISNYGDYKSKLTGGVVEVTKTTSGTLDVSKPVAKPAMDDKKVAGNDTKN